MSGLAVRRPPAQTRRRRDLAVEKQKADRDAGTPGPPSKSRAPRSRDVHWVGRVVGTPARSFASRPKIAIHARAESLWPVHFARAKNSFHSLSAGRCRHPAGPRLLHLKLPHRHPRCPGRCSSRTDAVLCAHGSSLSARRGGHPRNRFSRTRMRRPSLPPIRFREPRDHRIGGKLRSRSIAAYVCCARRCCYVQPHRRPGTRALRRP